MSITYDVSKQKGSSRWYPHKIETPKVPAGPLGDKKQALHAAAELMRVNYTPEEIAEMHDRNENFNGTRANFSKIKLYQAVKSDLVEFMNICDDVRMIDGYDPNMKEKHAILWLDFSPAATLNKEETAALTAIMSKADGTVISAVDGHVRISFDINDIWDN